MKHTHASRALAAAAAAALAVSGCGGSTKTVTTTTTARASAATTATTTVTADSTSSGGANSTTQVNPAKGRDYPRVFATSFMKSCTGAGGSPSACSCALANIEAHVPYATVIEEVASGKFLSSAGYKLAVTSCAGR